MKMRQVYKRLNTLLNVAYASFGIKIYVLTSLEINVLLLQCENYYGILKKKKKTVGYGTEYSALYWIYGIYVQVLDCKIRISSLFLIWLMLEDSAGKVFAD